MNAIRVKTAADLGVQSGAKRIIIIAMDGNSYGITTWGHTRYACKALAKWAESEAAVNALMEIADKRPTDLAINYADVPGWPEE